MANLRKWALAIAIAIVFNLFVNYGISLFYKAPQYDDFCKGQAREGLYPAPVKTIPPDVQQAPCQAFMPSQELQANCSEQRGNIAYKYNATGCQTEAYCETCNARFDEVNQKRNSYIFIVLVVFGVAAIIAGMGLKAEAVANGFLLGGILSLIIAAIRIGGQLPDLFKLLIIAVVLAILIWLGYKKNSTISKTK